MGTLLPIALCIAINPASIIAAILLLTSNRGLTKGLAYLAGWLIGLTTLISTTLLLVIGWDVSGVGISEQLAAWIILIAGIALLLLTLNQWRQRPPPNAEIMPFDWLRVLPRATSFMALSAGLFFCLFNMKNLLLTIAAAMVIGDVGLVLDESTMPIVLFVAVASLGIAVPILVSMTQRDRARIILTDWENRLSTHNVTITCIVLVIIAVQMVGIGLGRLLGA